jgi:beta-lactamase regulating signal transducer with metallopeptidase domain
MGFPGADPQGKEKNAVSTLLDLSLRGSLVAIAVWILDRMLAGRMAARGRRCWWALVPIAFLVSIPIPVLSKEAALASANPGNVTDAAVVPLSHFSPGVFTGSDFKTFFLALWIAGAAIYLLVVFLQTQSAVRRWSRLRLTTDPRLLEILEDCKARAGVTAPIGLIVSKDVSVPALMGWLRPRILLPENTVAVLSTTQLRGVLSHELAHFRSLDIPLNWLFTLARAVHWFNPVVHLISWAWVGFREEAADESALRAMKESSGLSYGDTLLAVLRKAQGSPIPFGALASGESIYHLKRRLIMINHYPNRSPRHLAAIFVLTVFVTGFVLRPVRAADTDPKGAAEAAMQTWLGEMDGGQYAQSWKDASPAFQQAVAEQKWTDLSTSVRTPLGKCLNRKLASAMEQTDVPGGTPKGDFVIAQFNSSFENLKYAIETVTFEKAPD